LVTNRLADLAAMVGAELVGDPDRPIDGVATLEVAGERDLSFLTNPRYRDQARSSGAGALLVPKDITPDTLSGLRADLVGRGTKIDNLVQIGHNAQIGKGCILCGQAGVSGSSRIGDRVLLAGQAGVAGHFDIGDGVQVAAKSAVFQEVPPGQRVAGIPATPIAAWRRRNALQSRLPAMRAALRGLECRVQELEVAGIDSAAASAPAADREPDRGDGK
jgi:UDP-3-O-[3-hydroxymyristoyl] glucosamine N-acyltransferase